MKIKWDNIYVQIKVPDTKKSHNLEPTWTYSSRKEPQTANFPWKGIPDVPSLVIGRQ